MVGATVAGTDPDQARACLRESRDLSTALGYQSTTDLNWATATRNAVAVAQLRAVVLW